MARNSWTFLELLEIANIKLKCKNTEVLHAEMKKCWNTNVVKCSYAGMDGNGGNYEMKKIWNAELLKCLNADMLINWNSEVLKWWSAKVMKCWKCWNYEIMKWWIGLKLLEVAWNSSKWPEIAGIVHGLCCFGPWSYIWTDLLMMMNEMKWPL